MAFDPYDPDRELKIAFADKSKPLKMIEATKDGTCVIRGCPISQYGWIVRIPGLGPACSGCASDKGWEVQ